MIDPISDMLTRIRNATQAGHPVVLIPMSKLKKKIAELIQGRKFLEKVGTEEVEGRSMLRIKLKYSVDEKGKSAPFIQGIRRVSRQGQRIYVGKDNIPSVKKGLGFAIISTSKGLMTDSGARRAGLGGEIICEIW